MSFIGSILLFALQIYLWIIILSVILSWLIAFEVVNPRNEKAQNLIRLLDRVTVAEAPVDVPYASDSVQQCAASYLVDTRPVA